MRAEAVQGIDIALKRHPEHHELRYQRAVELDGAGRSREAIKEFEALLKERPDDANVQNALGYTLADRKRSLSRAERLIRSALEQRPDNAAFLDSLGWVRYRRGDKAGALPHLERAWRLSYEGEIAAHWGEVLWSMGDQAGARSVWARALVTAPDSKPLRATLERFTGAAPDRKP
jgi:Flp pilus assembly protein TadD